MIQTSFDEKYNWLKRNPVTVAKLFHYRLSVLFHDFLKSTAQPLGEIWDYAIRIEFQARGYPHAHCVMWVKKCQSTVNALTALCVTLLTSIFHVESKNKMANCKDLVLLLQKHKHSSYCRQNKTCHFSFPKPPSSTTLITQDNAEQIRLDRL